MAEHLKKVLAAAGRLRERAVSACFSATFRVPGANFGRRMRLVRSQEHTAGGGTMGRRRGSGCEAARLSQALRRAEPEARVKLPLLLVRGTRPGWGLSGDGKQTRKGAWGETPPRRLPPDCEQEEAGSRAWSAQGGVSGWFARRNLTWAGLWRGRCPPLPAGHRPLLSALTSPSHPGPSPQGLKWRLHPHGWLGGRLAQAGCQLREKTALEGPRRCPELCPHVLPKPCLVPQGEGKAQSHWSPSSSENDIHSWIRRVEEIVRHPPTPCPGPGRHACLPTAVHITTNWVTCSNRNLSSYTSGPKHPDQGVGTPSRSSRGGPSRLSQLLRVQELLGLWSHPPSLCSVVAGPLRLLCLSQGQWLLGLGGTQVIQDNLI